MCSVKKIYAVSPGVLCKTEATAAAEHPGAKLKLQQLVKEF